MGRITIRPMISEDIDAIVLHEEIVFKNTLGKKLLNRELNDNQFAEYYVMLNNGDLIGYIGLWCIFDNGQITNFYIHPDFQGRGYGKQLLEFALKIFKAKVYVITLEVRKSNMKAQELYKKYGFYVGGTRKNYYENSEDALLMVCDIEGENNDNTSN